ncbi:TPA: hypothetical protein U2Q33_000742 [Citrobacter farmeri]|nr:hypothetical protein [Citrobacter farmeri]
MWQAIINWPWGTIWAAVSAISTLSTVCVALWAMLRWRKQEELKVKLAFKQAIGDYSFQLVRMPVTIFTNELSKHENDMRRLSVLYHACIHAMAMTEMLLDENDVVSKNWDAFADAHTNYLLGKINSDDIDNICTNIINEPFVFGK